MAKLLIKNWRDFQHYKHRNPPWIKLHVGLLDDFEFQCLPVASRALAPMLWLIASRSEDGSVEYDLDFLSFRLRDSKENISAAVQPLIDKGFISLVQDASAALAYRKQDAHTEKSRDREETEGLHLEAFDGQLAFHHLCTVYKKAEASRITIQRYEEAVESVVKAQHCTRTDAAAHIAHKAEIYCSLVEPKFQKGLTNWLEMKIFNQPEAAWGNAPKLVSSKNPAAEMRRQLEAD